MREPINYLPAAHLRSYILSYGILTVPEGTTEAYFSPPIGLSGFIIHTMNAHNKIVAKIGDTDHFTDMAVATGQITRPVYGQNIGEVRVLLVFFHPMGMHLLFGTDMSALTNTSAPLSAILGERRYEQLMSTLKACQEDAHQTGVLDNFFSEQLPIQNIVSDRLRNILEFIHDRKGDINIRELEKITFIHRKTLERLFHKFIGISPKVYCQIYRFKCLLALIRSQPEFTWTQLSLKAGYYDQSHVSRYVKEYLRVSPNRIIKMEMQLINYLLSR